VYVHWTQRFSRHLTEAEDRYHRIPENPDLHLDVLEKLLEILDADVMNSTERRLKEDYVRRREEIDGEYLPLLEELEREYLDCRDPLKKPEIRRRINEVRERYYGALLLDVFKWVFGRVQIVGEKGVSG